jgi:hypothetical protein
MEVKKLTLLVCLYLKLAVTGIGIAEFRAHDTPQLKFNASNFLLQGIDFAGKHMMIVCEWFMGGLTFPVNVTHCT